MHDRIPGSLIATGEDRTTAAWSSPSVRIIVSPPRPRRGPAAGAAGCNWRN